MKIEDVFIADATRPAFAHLLAKLEGIDLPEPAGWRVLVLQYIRPEKSSGGILFADATKVEDKWQGRIGLVLKTGPGCWGDKSRYPEGAWAGPGDVVMWPKLESAATRFEVDGVVMAFLNDDSIVGTGVDPVRSIG